MSNFLRSARRFARRAAILPVVALIAAACGEDDPPLPPEITETIAQIASGQANLSTLVTALSSAELVATLNGAGPFTVFAPTNAAFEALPPSELARLLEPANQAELQEVLTYHVVSGAFFAADLSEGQQLTTVAGPSLTISLAGGPTVNGVDIINTDTEASNGVIHFIDEVLLPPRPNIGTLAGQTAGLETLATAVGAAGLGETLNGAGPFTVFAPVNSAFTALGQETIDALLADEGIATLTDILTYHVVAGAGVFSDDLSDGQVFTTVNGQELEIGVNGGAVTVNGVDVVTANVRAGNGVVHLIDEVLLPEFDIVDVATTTADVSTLNTALLAADLQGALKGEGPFTVFAPINSAFAALDPFTLGQLLADGNEALLTEVLTYHVVPGEVLAAQLVDGGTATTLEGRDLTFDLSDPQDPRVNGVSIITTDIPALNGVIHLVDEVIVPEFDIVEVAQTTEITSTLVTAVGAAGLVETLKGEGPFTVFAPNNAAFEALGEFTLDALLAAENQGILSDVLTYHVVPGDVRLADVVALGDGASVATVEGGEVTFDLSDPQDPKVNGASIIATDIVAENGVIHVIDGVLTESLDIVERAIVTEQTETLTAAVVAGDLVTTLQGAGPFTVFAPINEAFAALGTDRLDVLLDPANQALLQKVLTYHVVPGDVRLADVVALGDGASVATVEGSNVTFDLSDPQDPRVNGASIIATDIVTENGVIHLIDGVLTENLDIVDQAVVNGFSTLVSLVAQQELVDVLRGDNMGAGYTVFAPTNAAFEALAAVPEGDALTQVLLYHVVGATVFAGDLTDGQIVTTANAAGDTFTVNIGEGVTITDGAGTTVNVVLTDVEASNGVIHVVDAVLLPPPAGN